MTPFPLVNHSGGNGRFAIRQGNWKLELCPGSGGWGKPGDDAALNEGMPTIQLYNLRDDIGEKSNVEGANAEVVTNLVKLLQKYVTDGRSTAGPRQTNDVRVDIWRDKNQNGRETPAPVKGSRESAAELPSTPTGKVLAGYVEAVNSGNFGRPAPVGATPVADRQLSRSAEVKSGSLSLPRN